MNYIQFDQRNRRDHILKSFTNEVIEPVANLTNDAGMGDAGENMGGQGIDKAKKGMLIKGKFRLIKGCHGKRKKKSITSSILN